MSDSSPTAGSLAPPISEAQPDQAATILRHVAHQIRQPLSVIEAIAYYLDLILPEAEARSQVGKLRQQAHEIDRILSDTAYYLQASPLQLRPVDLSKLISHYLSDWPAPGDLDIHLRLSDSLPAARLDVQQVQHLLGNLLLLFARIVPSGHPVVLSASAGTNEVLLEIAAGKSNYSADEIIQMLEPFSTHAAGAGLMMASVLRIADVHNARIAIQSGPTGGLSVSVAFPV